MASWGSGLKDVKLLGTSLAMVLLAHLSRVAYVWCKGGKVCIMHTVSQGGVQHDCRSPLRGRPVNRVHHVCVQNCEAQRYSTVL